jgi:hypothetical protein
MMWADPGCNVECELPEFGQLICCARIFDWNLEYLPAGDQRAELNPPSACESTFSPVSSERARRAV